MLYDSRDNPAIVYSCLSDCLYDIIHIYNHHVLLFGTGEWESMAKYASHLPRDGYTDCFFKAVLSIHRGNFRQAQMVYMYAYIDVPNVCVCMYVCGDLPLGWAYKLMVHFSPTLNNYISKSIIL